MKKSPVDNNTTTIFGDGVYFDGMNGYMSGTKAAITVTTSKKQFLKPDGNPVKIDAFPNIGGYVPWGKNNNLPKEVVDKVAAAELTASNMKSNIEISYGSGIITGEILYNEKQQPYFSPKSFPEVQEFFKKNDINNTLFKVLTDMEHLYMGFVELTLNNEDSNRKVVGAYHKSSVFSRVEEPDVNGKVNNHFYSALFAEGKKPTGIDDVSINPMLDEDNMVMDALERLGLSPNEDGLMVDKGEQRLIVPLVYPTAGMGTYPSPAYWAMFKSGWYDFMIAIPEFKMAIMRNQMTVKYHIELHQNYFVDLLKAEGITDEKKKKERIAEEFKSLNDFLSDTKNTGKSTISFVKYGPKGEERMMKINVIENHYKGGEYIEDAEGVFNIISNAMGSHPAVNGSAPGANKTINGTEARELFIIAQSKKQPLRHRAVKWLYVIKAINKWPDNLEFAVADTVLTTLDQGTGSMKKIS